MINEFETSHEDLGKDLLETFPISWTFPGEQDRDLIRLVDEPEFQPLHFALHSQRQDLI